MRPGDLSRNTQHDTLGSRGYIADPGRVERSGRGYALYHYTHQEHLASILAEGSGLNARLPVVGSALPPELAGGHLTEALLEPLPRWLTKSPYLGDLGLRMMREYVGDLLLHIQLPTDFPGLWVADAAHCMECKHMRRHGRKPLGLGYDCANGRECTEAEARSYIPLGEYRGGHVAPIAKIVRPGQGLAVPNRYIGVTDVQPLRRGDTS